MAALAAANLAGKSLLRDDRSRRHLENLRNTFDAMLTPIRDGMTEALAAYLVQGVETFYQGHANFRLPTAFILNERIIPRIVKATVGRGRWFEARPRTPDEIDKCRSTESLLYAQMDEDRFRAKYTSFIREAGVLGTGIWKNCWLYEVRRAPRMVRESEPYAIGPEGPVEQESASFVVEDRVMRLGPSGDRVDPYQIFCNPRICSDNDDIIDEQVLSLTQMKALVRQGVFSKSQVERVIRENEGRVQEDRQSRSQERDALLNMDHYHEPFHGERLYQYREGWVNFPIEVTDGDTDTAETVPCLIGVIGNVTVQLRRNPFNSQRNPYQFARFISYPGMRFGLSLTKMNMGLFVEETDIHNQTSDARTYGLIPMLAVNPGSRKKGSYTASPGKVVEAEKVTQFAYPDLTATGIVGMRQIRETQEDAFGAPSLLSGQPISGESGATGAAIRQQEANIRIQAMAEEVEESFLKPMLEQWHDFNEQFLDTTRRVLVLGEQGFEHRVITRSDILGQFDFIPMASSQMIAKSLLAANYQAITPLLMEKWMADPDSVDIDRWLSDLLYEVFEKDHPEIYITSQKKRGRPKSLLEILLMISMGHRVKPDPRQDFLMALTEYGKFMEQYGDTMEPELRRAVSEYGAELEAAAKEQALAKQAQQMEMAMGAGPAGPPGGAGGPPAPIGPAQRDGQGLGMNRRLSGAMQGASGRGR